VSKNLFDLTWGDNDMLVTQIKEMRKDRLSDLREMHRDMYLNILWGIMGKQDVYYDRYTKSLLDLKPEPWQVQVISNLLFPMIRRTVAKLSKKPIWDAMPATTEQEDINVSHVGTKALQSYWYYLKMPTKLIKAIFWAATTGNAFFKVGWDPDLGERIQLTEEDRAVLLNITGKKRIPKEIYLGDIFSEITSPFSIIWEKGVELDESPWVMELKLRSPDDVKDRYKVELAPAKRGEEDIFDYKLMDIFGPITHGNKILVTEFYTAKKFVIITNNQVVSKGKNPYDVGANPEWNPYVHFKEVEIPGFEWGMSSIKQNRGNQAQYNKIRSKIIEHVNLMCNPKWLSPRQAGLKRGVFTDKAGEVIEYNYPMEPKQTTVKPLPAYVERTLQQCKLDMQDIGSTHQVSEAKTEPGLRSGRAVLALQDADDVILGPVLQQLDNALSLMGRKILKILADNVTEERLLRITGEDNVTEVASFMGSQLYGPNKGRPGTDYFDVRIISYTSYPLSRIGMEDRLDRLLERGVLHPQQDKDKILQILGSGEIQSTFDARRQDRVRATAENYRIENGEQIEAMDIEEHSVHIELHTRFIKAKRDTLQNMQGLMQHLNEHRQFAAQQQQFMMQQQIQFAQASKAKAS
jgi:hypothetical protein